MDTLALARRIELCGAWRSKRYTEAYQRLHAEAHCAELAVAGGTAFFIKPGSPVNGAQGLGMAGPVSAQDIDALEDFFHSRGAAASIAICPLADETLVEQVRERGYRLSHFLSVLACQLPREYQPAPVPAGIQVRAAGADEADQWLLTVAQGFEGNSTPSAEGLDILGPNFYAEDSLPFLAWIADGAGLQPAGGGGLYLAPAQRAFELGGASTRAEYRRRGAQRGLIEARMAEALRRGCDLASVKTEPGSDSERNLRRAGFSLAYTKVVMQLPG